jgi:hypothetical protein
MAGFYKVVLNGTYKGKDNQNTLYYRTALDLAGGLFGFGGAAELAEEVHQEVVPAFLDCKPTEYILQTIDVIPRNGAFELLYQLPYKREVNEQGTGITLSNLTDGPALAINFKFNLEPVLLGLQAFTAPKRGYIAVGPVASSWVDDSGKLDSTMLADVEGIFQKLGDALSQNLESIDPPAVWFPIRVAEHYGSVTGGLLGWGYADVMGCSVDEYVTFRRSRRIAG